MKININIDSKVPNDEVAYILRQVAHKFDIGDLAHLSIRVFDSNGDPVGEADISHPVPLQAPESPVEAR